MSLDLKKTLKYLYAPSEKEVSIVNVPPLNYLMIEGEGNPTTQLYQESVQALYTLAYGVRGIRKAAGEVFTVMPLEGLWMIKDQTEITYSLTQADKDNFIWTLMILQPESVTAEVVEQARSNAQMKQDAPSRLMDVRFEQYHEGESVQLMHRGSYAEEGPTVKRLHDYIHENGFKLGKDHHEIYLSDPRKVSAPRMKTIIRQPFTR